MATEQERQGVKQAVDAWADAAAAGDPSRLKGLWDQQYPHLVYIAEEEEFPITSWAGIDSYYGTDTDSDRAWSYRDLVLDSFGDTAYAQILCNGEAGRSPRMEYVMRITFVFRKVGGQWKIIHFHESANPTIGPDGHEVG